MNKSNKIKGLDKGIAPYVKILIENGVETFESCEGGKGHCVNEPMVRFYGSRGEGFRVLGIAQIYGLPVAALYREWIIEDGEPTGAAWRMVFKYPACQGTPYQKQLDIQKASL